MLVAVLPGLSPRDAEQLRLRVAGVVEQLLDDRTRPHLVRAADAEDVLVCGPIRLSRDDKRVSVDGRPLGLTYQEFRLLETLMLNPGRVLSRSQLLALAWDEPDWRTGRTVDVHVRRVRRKLGEAAHFVETARGFGYRLRG